MRVTSWVLSVVGLSCASAAAQAAEPESLALERVRFYDAGIAYFERHGVFDKNGYASLELPTGQLDDALKTLVVLSPDGQARVDGASFRTRISWEAARIQAGLSRSAATNLRWFDIVSSLRGFEVEASTRSSGRIVGTLLDVQAPKDAIAEACATRASAESGDRSGDRSIDRIDGALCVTRLTLLTASGELRSVLESDLSGVRATRAEVRHRIQAAFDVLIDRSAQSERAVRVTGSPGARIALGYVTEAPVWRASYRLVIDDARGRLQGFALVHNDSDEAWTNLAVEITNGEPDSFLYPLAAPSYRHRRLEQPEDATLPYPQLLEPMFSEASGSMWGDTIGDAYGSGGLGLTGIGEGGGGRGEGLASTPQSSSLLSVGGLAHTETNAGDEAGALFVYALPKRLSLQAHSSALLPFVSTEMSAERAVWFAEPGRMATNMLRIVNTSDQTLPPGPLVCSWMAVSPARRGSRG